MSAEAEAPASRRYLPELALFGVTVLWGCTFLATKVSLVEVGPLGFLALRFGVATVALAACSVPQLRQGFSRVELASTLPVGLPMAAGYILQGLGLPWISSSRSAFLIALYVPLVPIVELIALRQVPRPAVWIGIAVAFTGLVLLAGPGEIGRLSLGPGEWLTLASAAVTALQIVILGAYAERVDPRRAAVLQLATVALVSALLTPIAGETFGGMGPLALTCALGLGLVSAVIQLAMNWAQRSVSASRATLIYAGEPVYAGLIGRLAGERMQGLAIIGAVLIVLSVVVSELRLPSRGGTQGGQGR